MTRYVKVTTTTIVKAYTPEDYAHWKAETSSRIGEKGTAGFPLPATIEECVAYEEKLLNEPSKPDKYGLDLETYLEQAVSSTKVVLELLPEDFSPEG